MGSDSAAVDFEILALMKAALSAIGVDSVTIKLSHRGVFNRFLANRGLSGKSEDILRTVDKLAKIGEAETLSLLTEIAGAENAREIITYVMGAGKILRPSTPRSRSSSAWREAPPKTQSGFATSGRSW